MKVFVCWTEGPEGVQGMRVFQDPDKANDYLEDEKIANQDVSNVEYQMEEHEVE